MSDTNGSPKWQRVAIVVLFIAVSGCIIFIVGWGYPAYRQVGSLKVRMNVTEEKAGTALKLAKSTDKKFTDTTEVFHKMVQDLKAASQQLADIKNSDKTTEEKLKLIDQFQIKINKLTKTVTDTGQANLIKKFTKELHEVKAKVKILDEAVIARGNEVDILRKQLEEQRRYYDSLAVAKNKSFFSSSKTEKKKKKEEVKEVKENKMELPTDGKMGKKSSTTGQDYPDGFK